MDKPAHLIREQDVDLLWLDDRRHLSKADSRMRHRLPLAICARPIVRRAVFSREAVACRRFAFFECGVCAAFWAVHTRNLTSLVERDHHVPPFLATRHA